MSLLEPGQTFTFRRTFTDGDVSMFCGVTGDYNPFHTDEAFSRGTRFGARIVPGLLTGSMMTHIGGLLGVLAGEMQFTFLAPVYIGDTITCTVTVASVDDRGVARAEAEMVNETGVTVTRGGFVGKPKQVRLAGD